MTSTSPRGSLRRRVATGSKTSALRSLLRLPPAVVRGLAGSPVVLQGRTLDPEMQLILRLQAMEGPPAEALPLEHGRRTIVSGSRLVGGVQPVGSVTDRTIDGPDGPLPLRFYTPRGTTGTGPALLFVHGGGWIYGGLESHDAVCRFLAERAGVRVVAVDYRLAPEHPFPAAVDDVLATWHWLQANAEGLGIDPARLAVGGDSAGGNLAAVLAQQAVARGFVAPAFQLLIYPATDFGPARPSRTTYADGFFLTKAFMDLAELHYVPEGADRTDPRLSPAYGELAGLPPAYVVTAGFDPLSDEGAEYAAAMKDAGVAVEHVREDGLIHSFANMVGVGRSAPEAMGRTADVLRRALG